MPSFVKAIWKMAMTLCLYPLFLIFMVGLFAVPFAADFLHKNMRVSAILDEDEKMLDNYGWIELIESNHVFQKETGDLMVNGPDSWEYANYFVGEQRQALKEKWHLPNHHFAVRYAHDNQKDIEVAGQSFLDFSYSGWLVPLSADIGLILAYSLFWLICKKGSELILGKAEAEEFLDDLRSPKGGSVSSNTHAGQDDFERYEASQRRDDAEAKRREEEDDDRRSEQASSMGP